MNTRYVFTTSSDWPDGAFAYLQWSLLDGAHECIVRLPKPACEMGRGDRFEWNGRECVVLFNIPSSEEVCAARVADVLARYGRVPTRGDGGLGAVVIPSDDEAHS